MHFVYLLEPAGVNGFQRFGPFWQLKNKKKAGTNPAFLQQTNYLLLIVVNSAMGTRPRIAPLVQAR